MRYSEKVIILSVVASSFVFATSGWRVAEQSARAVALSGAYSAHVEGADSAFFNPANMSFNDDKHSFSISLMYMDSPSIHYEDARNSAYNGDSKQEDFLLPSLFYTSRAYDDFRFGLSITNPGWMSREWEDPYPKAFAQELTLKITELNPVVSYAVTPEVSIAGGVRVLYGKNVLKSDASGIGMDIQRDAEGNDWAFGYNLALSYRPTSRLSLATTYRSKVNLKEEGNTRLYTNGKKVYDDDANVVIPSPALFTLAASYEFEGGTTAEISYDRTFWSSYKVVDYEYNKPIPVGLQPIFDAPKSKNWSDTDTIRLGITQEIGDHYEVMFGAGYDRNGDDDRKIDSDGWFLSLGASYRIDERQKIVFGYLYNANEDQDLQVANPKGVNGTFSNVETHLVSFSYNIAF